jgi:hypothetical protein
MGGAELAENKKKNLGELCLRELLLRMAQVPDLRSY